jgi:ketosteroid isomerase-like protein
LELFEAFTSGTVSAANVEIVRRVIGAFNRRDVDGIVACVNADLEWFPAMPVTVGEAALRGRDGIESYLREVGDAWEEYRVNLEDLREPGEDRVLALGRVVGRGAGSGGVVDAELGQIFDFRDGAISRVRTYLDHAEALRAAGSSE